MKEIISRQNRRVALAATITVCGVAIAPTTVGSEARAGATAPTSRASVAQSNSILRLYRAYFLRDPDQGGLAHWVNQYSSGRMSLAAISDYFSQSQEFIERYGSLSDAEFVRLVYQNVLGRFPDSKGEGHWTGRMAEGMVRGEVMTGFSESLEFQRKTGTLITGTEQPAPDAWVAEIVALVNAERRGNGLPALTHCPPLSKAATAHSVDQARNNALAHVGSDGSTGDQRIERAGYRWSWWAENVADGFTSPGPLVDAWMNSATHRKNILNPNFVHVGFGRAESSSGRLYWTQKLGAGGTC